MEKVPEDLVPAFSVSNFGMSLDSGEITVCVTQGFVGVDGEPNVPTGKLCNQQTFLDCDSFRFPVNYFRYLPDDPANTFASSPPWLQNSWEFSTSSGDRSRSSNRLQRAQPTGTRHTSVLRVMSSSTVSTSSARSAGSRWSVNEDNELVVSAVSNDLRRGTSDGL